MTDDYAIKMIKEIIREKIASTPYHYDEEVKDNVYEDMRTVNELLALNKHIMQKFEYVDKYKWHVMTGIEDMDEYPKISDWVEIRKSSAYQDIVIGKYAIDWFDINGKYIDDKDVIEWRYIS